MHTILVSMDEGLVRLLELEKFQVGIILRFAILNYPFLEIRFSHSEIKKNIRLLLEERYFFNLNSVCNQTNSYVNEYAGELILEMFLDIIRKDAII